MVAETPAFIDTMKVFMEEITPKEDYPDDGVEVVDDLAYLSQLLQKIEAACGDYDENAIEEILEELRNGKWSHNVLDLIAKIDEQLLHSEFDEILESIKQFME